MCIRDRFVDESVNSLFDLKVFVDADPETRLRRRLERDVQERGRTESSVRAQWSNTVEAMYREFVAPTQNGCDITIDTDSDSSRAMAGVVEEIRRLRQSS